MGRAAFWRVSEVCAVFICLFSTVVASAQSCYTVRDANGSIVYRSIRPPVDVDVPYQDKIEELFPGGYLEVSHIFNACGSYERKVQVEMAPQRPDQRRDAVVLGKSSALSEPASVPAPQKGLFDDMPTPNAAQLASPSVATQQPTQNQGLENNSFGEYMPKVLAAVLIGAILGLKKKAWYVALAVLGGLFLAGLGFVVYESVRPPPQPFAQCVIDRASPIQNTPALMAALGACVERNPGGWNSHDYKIYSRGSAKGWGRPKSRADCVAKYAATTGNENVARVIFQACDCLYAAPSEDKPDGTNPFVCGYLP